MAMTLLNDSSVALSLGQLNKNINKVGKSLAKLATGQRITGASVDTASFAISEKMREQLRSLEQDIQNVQNGSAMLKAAHGGIEDIVDELRSLKELAINAANDSNTDADRQIIQKEFDKRRDTIDDIATTTNYNNKPLLDGTYFRPRMEGHLVTFKEWVTIEDDSVGSASDDDEEETSYTPPLGGTVEAVDSRSIYTSGVTGFFPSLETVTMYGKSGKMSWVNNREAYGLSSSAGGSERNGVRRQLSFDMNFSSLQAREEGRELNLPNDIHGQGFSMFCSDYNGCAHTHAFVFDANKSVGTGERVTNGDSYAYVVGIKNLNSLDDLAAALYDGVKNIVSQAGDSRISISGDTIYLKEHSDSISITKNTTDGSSTYSMKNERYAAWIYEGYDMTGIFTEPLPPPPPGNPIPFPGNPDEGYWQYITKLVNEEKYNPLTIHHGTHSNQRTNFFIEDMHTKSLKAKIPNEKDLEDLRLVSNDTEKSDALNDLLYEAQNTPLDKASVRTRHDANVTIRIVDSAIEYALNEATYMGAYLQRLEYTEANVTAQDENTQGAESTIRDADMAKEMTEYTKNNVLSQAAQSMLAQANQNLSSVLSLLQ